MRSRRTGLDRRASRIAAVIASALLIGASIGGCGGVPAPPLGAGPIDRVEGGIFEETLIAVRTAGYRPIDIEAESGRFVVIARSDSQGATRFVVQCFRDGWISVVPSGPGVTEAGGRYSMPRAIRTEYARLAEEIDQAMTVGR